MGRAALAGLALFTALAAPAAFACQDCLEDDVPAPKAKQPSQSAEVTITDAGFSPRELNVKAGVPLKLKVTRTSAKRCAAGFTVEGYTVPIALPLNQAIEVELTPDKPGRVRLRCEGGAGGTLTVS